MKKENYMSWDTYFMSIATISSFRSKDNLAKNQNGACIADSKTNKILGIGYNGLPNGLDDNDKHYWQESEDMEKTKHTYMLHAEQNAILNSNLGSLKGGKIYVTQFPCFKCAQMIIQVGIKKLIYLVKEDHNDKHLKNNKAVMKMFNDAEVEVLKFSDMIRDDTEFIDELNKLNQKFYPD